jgi:prophage DNA circulation protein
MANDSLPQKQTALAALWESAVSDETPNERVLRTVQDLSVLQSQTDLAVAHLKHAIPATEATRQEEERTKQVRLTEHGKTRRSLIDTGPTYAAVLVILALMVVGQVTQLNAIVLLVALAIKQLPEIIQRITGGGS